MIERNDSESVQPLVGIVRHGSEPTPTPDPEIDRVLRSMCRVGGQHRPPRDLADELIARLDRGDSPRGVAEWLRDQLDATPRWLSFVLDGPPPRPRPTREQVLERLDEVERRDGSSDVLREARRRLLELPDETLSGE